MVLEWLDGPNLYRSLEAMNRLGRTNPRLYNSLLGPQGRYHARYANILNTVNAGRAAWNRHFPPGAITPLFADSPSALLRLFPLVPRQERERLMVFLLSDDAEPIGSQDPIEYLTNAAPYLTQHEFNQVVDAALVIDQRQRRADRLGEIARHIERVDERQLNRVLGAVDTLVRAPEPNERAHMLAHIGPLLAHMDEERVREYVDFILTLGNDDERLLNTALRSIGQGLEHVPEDQRRRVVDTILAAGGPGVLQLLWPGLGYVDNDHRDIGGRTQRERFFADVDAIIANDHNDDEMAAENLLNGVGTGFADMNEDQINQYVEAVLGSDRYYDLSTQLDALGPGARYVERSRLNEIVARILDLDDPGAGRAIASLAPWLDFFTEPQRQALLDRALSFQNPEYRALAMLTLLHGQPDPAAASEPAPEAPADINGLDRNRILDQHDNGFSVDEIAADLNLASDLVQDVIQEENLRIALDERVEEDRNRILEQHDNGFSVDEIAADLNLASDLVQDVIREENLRATIRTFGGV